MTLTSVELIQLQNSILKLGCLATSTILNYGSHEPPARHNFLFFPAWRPRPPPSCSWAWAPSAADSVAHAASPSPSAASGPTSSDRGLALASAARETYGVEAVVAADLLESAVPRSPPQWMRRPHWRRARRPARCHNITDAPVGRRKWWGNRPRCLASSTRLWHGVWLWSHACQTQTVYYATSMDPFFLLAQGSFKL
jgi:hypothetical protein